MEGEDTASINEEEGENSIIDTDSSEASIATLVYKQSVDIVAISEADPLPIEEVGRNTIVSWNALIKDGNSKPDILGMSYNSARNELFLADISNNVVRSLSVNETDHSAADLRDVYIGNAQEFVRSVCYLSDSDTLLVCLHENWLVALSRNGDKWCETRRVQTAKSAKICCALSGSQVLIGCDHSTQMQLFHVSIVDSRPHIESVQLIEMPLMYIKFTATCEGLVAVPYIEDDSVRVHRLRGGILEEVVTTKCNNPEEVLWNSKHRLFATELVQSQRRHDVIEFAFDESRGRLVGLRKLVCRSKPFQVRSWCNVGAGGLLIFDQNSRDLLYYLLSTSNNARV